MYYFNKDTRLQSLLHALKYRNKPEIGFLLGQRLGRRLLKTDWIKDVDCLIPVPLSNAKLQKRGYNQSQSIADGLADVLQLPVDSKSICRIKNTLSQTTMSVADRVKNVKDAFGVKNPSGLANKHIILIDDVLTTGATLESCANQIMKETEVKISILTIAFAIE
jgi:ComF family protein